MIITSSTVLRGVFLLLCSAVFMPVWALGLGTIDSKSTLFQPLDATIPLVGAETVASEQISVQFGSHNDYLQIGKQRPAFLSQIRLSVEKDDSNQLVIRLRSRKSLNEPVLNLLINFTSPQGTLQKNYHLLLDPPSWGAAQSGVAAIGQAPAVSSVSPEQVNADVLPTTREALIAAGLINGNLYGPVRDGDRISLIAERTRLDRSVTINQMMMAYVRANPSAFEAGNLSGLKQGEVLRIPSHNDARQLSRSAATARVAEHYTAWRSGQALLFSEGELPQTAESQAKVGLRILPESPDAVLQASGSALGAEREATVEALQKELAYQKQQLADAQRMLQLKEEQIESLERESQSKDAELAAQRQLLELLAQKVEGLEQKIDLISQRALAPAPSAVDEKTVFSAVLALLIGLPGLAGLVWFVYRSRRSASVAEPAPIPFAEMAAAEEETVPKERAVFTGPEMAAEKPDLDSSDTVHPPMLDIAVNDGTEGVETPLAETKQTDAATIDMDADGADGVLDEVEVYLTYGLFHQSEELLSAAIESNPEKTSYKVKLLETLLVAGKCDEFESYAQNYRKDLDTEQWDMIKKYAIDSGVRPAFFNNESGSETEWVDDDLELLMALEPGDVLPKTEDGPEVAEPDSTQEEGVEPILPPLDEILCGSEKQKTSQR